MIDFDGLGSNVHVIRDFGGTQNRATFKAVKNREKGSGRDYFGFPPGSNVEAGDVLQPDQTTDFWDVVDTETQVLMGSPLQLKAFVKKRTARQIVKPAPPPPITLQRLHGKV